MQPVASNNDSVNAVASYTESVADFHLDLNNLKYETAPGKSCDFKLIFTTEEKQFYGRNKSKPNSERERDSLSSPIIFIQRNANQGHI